MSAALHRAIFGSRRLLTNSELRDHRDVSTERMGFLALSAVAVLYLPRRSSACQAGRRA
jgi:hypothetical protein